MPFWKIAWRNIEQRALASSLTALSMALGVAVMIAVIVIHSVAVRQFEQDAQGYNLIVGGKGGALQLVLSTVYYLGQPLYPIPYSYYEKFIDGGEFADLTEVAVPECLGDSYVAPNGEVFRIVATTPDLFDKIHYGNNPDGTPKVYEFQPGGRNLKNALSLDGEEFETAAFEAVVGSVAAARSGLHVGDKINPTHGLGAEGHKHDAFTIVGILKPTGTANDRAVFINIEGFYLLEGHALSGHDEHEADDDAEEAEHEHDHEAEDAHAHEHEHHEPLPLDQREVTSILVLCKSALGPTVLDTAINKGEGHVAQAVAPIREVTRLMDGIVGPIRLILLVLTVLIVIVAAISILVSIYNSMSERSHDIAVMRALGASRSAVMNIVLVESILLSLGGGLLGILLAHGMIGLASPYVEARTGVTLGWLQFEWQEIVLIPALVALASLVGFLPAVSAYRTDVAKALAGSR
jgi:putative ABC transport system permease protein